MALSFFHTVETFPSSSVETYTNLWHQCGCLSLGPVSAADDLPEGAGPPREGAARPKVEAQSSCFFKVRAQTWNCSNFSTERTNRKSKTFCFYYLQDTIKFDWTCFTPWIMSLAPFIYWSLCKMIILFAFPSCRQWWLFAIEANLSEIREKHWRGNWDFALLRARDVQTYTSLYFRKLKGIPLSPEEKVREESRV